MNINEMAELALDIVAEDPNPIAYDTETSGLDWKRNSVVGYVITNNEHSLYIPIRHGGGGNLDNALGLANPTDFSTPIHDFEKRLRIAFEAREYNGYKTALFNAKFDMHMSACHHIQLKRNIACCQMHEALLDEYARGFSLDASCKRRNVSVKHSERMYIHLSEKLGVKPVKASMEHFWRLRGDDPVVIEYSEGDGISTLELYHAQLPLLEKQGLNKVANMENRLIRTVFKMERKGIKLDVDAAKNAMTNLQEQADNLMATFPSGFNPRSGPQMRRLFEAEGVTDWPTTDKGNPSFKENWLLKSKLGKRVVELRKTTNLRNTFIKPLVEVHVFQGRIHATLNASKIDEYGTVGGRFSCVRPNLQAQPKRDKARGEIVRAAFVADEGKMLYEADWSQMEPRLYAEYGEVAALIRGYTSTPTIDSHSMTARMLEMERSLAKRLNMGLFTGLGIVNFAVHMEQPRSETDPLYRSWHGVYPEIKVFQKHAEAIMKTRGYVNTVLGRRCRLDNWRYAYKATSRIIQGNNAEAIKWKLLEIDEWIEETSAPIDLLMTVHDSIIWQADDNSEGEEASRYIAKMMVDVTGDPFNWIIPHVAEVTRGLDWAKASYSAEWYVIDTRDLK